MRYCSPAVAHRLGALRRAVGSRRMRFAGEQRGGAPGALPGGGGSGPRSSVRGCTEDAVVCSCLGDAVDDTRFRLAWVVSARPRFPRSVGAKRVWRSTYWMWTGAAAAEAGEAGERWRTAKRPELQKRKGGEKEKEASELSNSPGSAESESCGGGQPSDRSYRKGKEERRRRKRLNCQSLPAAPRARAAPAAAFFFSCPAPCSTFLAASTSAQQPIGPGASRPTVRSPPNRQAWLWERLPRCPMGWGSVGGPEPWSRLAPGTCYVRD
ncbi:uncharacterized protein LOC142084658 isoform X1 [Calonectris borealis]|uniref:uncharacterized protein LOC142084658 isoform X1 n=1 Tax=Calonectris borealis TaxID=1323832 RepID=UPI003F4BA523